MKALAHYVHSLGLKLGIYSSPGPQTCGGYEGSYQHEFQDAAQYARWGIDLLKYDWCSYGTVVRGKELADLQKPYRIMRAALDACGRDIVYSLCQYGMGAVWEWGAQVGANLWRTTGDITDTYNSMEGIGRSGADRAGWAGPGHWNDPDMLVVGKVGWGPKLHLTHLSAVEQIMHLSLWALQAAPLLIGCDLSQLDEFTTALLTNDEVLDIDQDPLGIAASRKWRQGTQEVWARPLADGTLAVGLINLGPEPAQITVTWATLALAGRQPVRDLWFRRDLGSFTDHFTAEVSRHGAVLLKIGKVPSQVAEA